MSNLEQWFNKSESIKEKWLDWGKQDELWKALNETTNDEWNEKGRMADISNKILNIDNEIIRDNIRYFFDKENCDLEVIDKEIAIYNKDIKPKLSDEWVNRVFSTLISNRKIKVVPSYLKKQFDIYNKLKVIELEDEKKIISHYMWEWFPPSLVEEEYDIYVDTKTQRFQSEKVKAFVLWLMENGVRPKTMDIYLSLFKEMTECDEKHIRDLLNYLDSY